jgi:type IV secretory pathway VirB2 component (pilin)
MNFFSDRSDKSVLLKNILYALIMTPLFLELFSTIVFATSSVGTTDIIGQQLCRVYNTLQGGTAKVLSFIILAMTGVSFVFGKVNWPTLMITVIGIFIIFFSGQLLAFITGTAANSSCQSGS